jgi:hypothetical protein
VASSFQNAQAGVYLSQKRDNKKSAGKPALCFQSKNLILLDLGFFEFHMLAHNWIIFRERELFSFRA